MALSLDQLTTITNDYIRPQLTDNIFTAIPLLNRLEKRGQIVHDGGTQIREPILYQKTGQAGGFDGTGPLPTTMNDVITGAEYNWVTYQAPLVYSRLEEAKNSGKTGIIKMVSALRQVVEMDIRDQIGTDVIVGNDASSETTELDGLELAIDDDNTPKNYGGIATTDFSGWAADDSALSAALSLSRVNRAIGAVTIGNDRPTLVLMTQNGYDKLWELLVADQRAVNTNTIDAGFQSMRFAGLDVLVDPNVPAATALTSETFYVVNEKYFKLYVHTDWNFKFRPFQEPDDQWSANSHVIWMGQLVGNNRRMHARRTAVNNS